ncbi:MAG: class D sortase [Candidatus Sulfotelmatobacter sp.]
MRFGENKPDEKAREQKVRNSTKGRTFSRIQRLLANLLLIVGLTLLGIYASSRIRGMLMSKAAVQRFEEQKRPAPTSAPADSQSEERTSPPDFLSWSENRIKAYQSGLGEHLAPPSAVLRIPKIHLEVPVFEGTDDLTLNRGVGRIPGTARIGEDGNIGLAGHRDGFFRGLKNIKIGDKLQLDEPDQTVTYVVDEVQIVKPTNVDVLQTRSKPSLTLVTCYPFYFIGSAPERYIVYASRIDFEPQKHNTTEQGS